MGLKKKSQNKCGENIIIENYNCYAFLIQLQLGKIKCFFLLDYLWENYLHIGFIKNVFL